jgi:para-aminobenzoate synthetase component 1
MFHLAYRKKKITKETPLAIFEKLRGEYSALLYSGKNSDGSKLQHGRYSYIGYEPFMLFQSKGGIQEISTIRYDADGTTRDAQVCGGEALDVFKTIFDQMKCKSIDDDFPPFVGGAMGVMSYDFGLSLHGIPYTTTDDLEIPDMYYAFYDKVVAFDHEMQDLYFFGIGETKEQSQKIAEEVHRDALKGLTYEQDATPQKRSGKRSNELNMYLTKEDFVKKIAVIKKHLKDGESYQVNFSHRFSYESTEDGWEIFKRLSAINPSPFSCYFEHPEFVIISSSPEKLVSVENGLVETKPIKGTRPRGKNPAEDKANEKDLLSSVKDEAELTMIVDLMRNDLGMVCEPKSIKVLDHRAIERYSHVMHTVTTVQGKLKSGMSIIDLVQAVFPGGSVTGCPKKRTMEIIAQLEDFHRDIYCGSAGYFSVNGNMAMNILIRTMLYRFGEVFFHSGSGIVMDSEALVEFDETLDKAQALLESLIGD